MECQKKIYPHSTLDMTDYTAVEKAI